MGKEVVIDTSVVVKWFIDEEDSRQARLLLNRWHKHQLEIVIPELLVYEVVNALKFGGKLPKTVILGVVKRFLAARPQVYVVNPGIVDLSLDYIFEHNLTIYDAVYVALADMLEIPLVTADVQHHRKEISENIVYLKDIKKVF